MESLSRPEHRASDVVAKLLVFRRQGISEEQIARMLKFSSLEDMYVQLREWDLPDWLIEERGARKQVSREKARKARRGSDKKIELPATKEAVPLLEKALDRLRRQVQSLTYRKEHLQDERFVAENHYPDIEAHVRYGSDDGFAYLMPPVGRTPNENGVIRYSPGEASVQESAGAAQHPPEPLSTLIAVYILSGLPLKPLLEKLHPPTDSADLDKLKLYIEGEKRKNGHIPGLRTRAQQIAQVVRGGKSRSGPSTGELTPEELFFAGYVSALQRSGMSEPEIHKHIRGHGFTREDVRRLAKLHLANLAD